MNMLHLSEEQLDDVLLGLAAKETTAHLEQCSDCRTQLAEIQSAIENFNAVTMSWGERRSATMPPQPVIEGPAWNHKLNWAAAAVIVAAVAVVIPLATRNSPNSMKLAAADSAVQQTQSQQTVPVMAQAPATSFANVTPVHEEVVAQDNQMLEAIDADLNASVESPSQTFGMDVSQGGGSRNHNLPIPISD